MTDHAARNQSAPTTHPDTAGMPGLLGIDHVGLAVADLDLAIEFHTQVLGLTLLHRETNSEQQVQEAMLGAAGATSATQVQLLAPLGPDSALARFLERSGPGLQQLAYRVSDVEAATAYLLQRGVRVLYDQAQHGTAGSLVNFAHPKDCGGVLVELVQPAASLSESPGSDYGHAQQPVRSPSQGASS